MSEKSEKSEKPEKLEATAMIEETKDSVTAPGGNNNRNSTASETSESTGNTEKSEKSEMAEKLEIPENLERRSYIGFKVTDNPYDDLRAIVLTKCLEAGQEYVREFFLSFHPEDESIKEDEIVWVNEPLITGETAPLYYVVMVVRGVFYVHAIAFGFEQLPKKTTVLEEYGDRLYRKYLEKNHLDESELKYKYGTVIMSNGVAEAV